MTHRPIDQIEADMIEANHLAARYRAELMDARREDCSIKVGDIVRTTLRGNRGTRLAREATEYLVTRVDVSYSAAHPSLRGRPRTKTGWHKTERYVFGDYEVVGHEEVPS